MDSNDKKSKKGLFKVTKAKVFFGGLATLLSLAVASHTLPLADKNLDSKKPSKGVESSVGDIVDNIDPIFNLPSIPIPPSIQDVPPSLEPEETINPDDEDYYFDEEDLDDKEENTQKEENIQENVDSLTDIDFSNLIIPNINAYKGRGNSIVDALNYCGYPSDKAYRAKLAAFFGIKDYQYLGYQNLQLMEYLYQYYAHVENNQDTNTNTDPGTTDSDVDNDTEVDNQEEQHTCSFGEWESLNDQKEIRKCSCGKQEERDHSYGPWMDLGNGKEVRFCKNCGHVHERNKHQEQECDHKLGGWKDNGNGTCSRSCSCGKEKETKTHVRGEFVSSRKYINNRNEYIEESTYKCANCGTTYTSSIKLGDVIVKEILGDDVNHKLICIIDGKEVEIGTEVHGYDDDNKCGSCGHEKINQQECDHKLGSWKDNGDGTCSSSCACGDKTETKLHVQGEEVSTEYVIEGENCIEVKTYYCANCKTKFNVKVNHGKIIKVSIPDNNDIHNIICTADGKILGTESHSCGEPTISYSDNGDGTHNKDSAYHCSGCSYDYVLTDVQNHGSGKWEAIDDQYEHLVDECGFEITVGEHPFIVKVNADGSKDYSCPNCKHEKHENPPEHIHGHTEVGRKYLKEDETGNCYVPIIGCVDGDMDTYEGTPVGHDFVVVSDDGNEIVYACSRQECGISYSEEVSPFAIQDSYDYQVDDEDDYDYEVDDEDDFDLQGNDIDNNGLVSRIELENALNEEIKARSLGLSYKG